ncbi:MAG: hypothetical protein QOE76_441 [Frankiales bacterium]|nr:hypothetical protein [Frankiales bacterium]
MLVAGRRPLPLLAATSVLVALISPASTAVASGSAVATLSLPGGLSVSGTVVVEAVGSVNPTGSDTVKTLSLYADGTLTDSAQSCDTGQKACAATLSWDSTGLTGPHSLTVKVVSTGGSTAMSAATIVTVTSPAPTASVQSPAAGSQVAGFVPVIGFGAVDASQTDTPQALQLYVDGKYNAQKSCSDEDAGCTETFSWDTTSLYGSHSLQVRIRTGNGVLAMSLPVTVQVGDPPAAHISTPAAGSRVTGVVTVTGVGTLDVLQPDTAKSLELLVDGAVTGTVPCGGPDPASCPARLAWDSTGAAGQHELQLKVATARGQTAVSPVVVVTADNPAPSVTLSTPDVVSGVGQVNVRGTVDASQADAGALVRLLADGRSVGTATCPAASKICAVAVSWDSKGLAGQHILQAQFTTTRGRTVSSAPSPVWVFSAVKVAIARPVPVVVGRTGTIAGRVTAPDGSGVPGASVRVVVRNSLGRPGTDLTVLTGPTGAFTASYKAVSKSSVSAVVVASVRHGASRASARVTVVAVPSCTLQVRVSRGIAEPVVCRLGDLGRGTRVALQSRRGGRWRTLTSARSTGATWTTGYVFRAKGTVWVRVSVAAGKDFGAAASTPVKVVVG